MKRSFVRILPKPEVLDVQGRAVLQMLNSQQLPFTQVRVGKLIELEGPDAKSFSSPNEIRELLKKAAQSGLYNPLIETAEIEGF